jgi:hypothetical protein
MPSFSMKDGVITVKDKITGISIKNLADIAAHAIEILGDRETHRISFKHGGLAVVSWNQSDGSNLNCQLEKVSQIYSPDPAIENGVVISLVAYRGEASTA